MERKTTSELNHEIKSATDIEDYFIKNKENMLKCPLCDHLNMLLATKNLSKVDVIRRSHLERKYVYQIFSGEKNPSRETLIALAFGFSLTDVETQTLLKLSGYRELYARDVRDTLLLFALQKNKTLLETNEILYKHDFPLLGSPDK